MTTVSDFVVWRRGDATHAQPEVWGAADARAACDLYVASNVDLVEAAGPGPLDTLKTTEGQADRSEP